jgi:toxin ParE1/3/4
MRPLRYVISKQAVSDLEEIWIYTSEKWPVEQADRYYLLIIEEINYICRNGDAGKKMDHVRKGNFASKVKSHLIFYRISNNMVEIIRILHERMDIDSRLTD